MNELKDHGKTCMCIECMNRVYGDYQLMSRVDHIPNFKSTRPRIALSKEVVMRIMDRADEVSRDSDD